MQTITQLPALVHVHIYYTEMWDELKSHLNNITIPYDLHVTLVKSNKVLENEIINFNPQSKIWLVENRGYDVWPFIKVLQNVNLDKYEFIIKMHTKRNTEDINVNGYLFVNDEWRKSLLRFADSRMRFEKALNSFNNDSSLGMITSFDCIQPMKKYKDVIKFAKKKFPNHVFGLRNYSFVAGTMFMAKAAIFKPIQEMKICAEMFDIPDKEHSLQFAHVLERVFGEAVEFAKLEIKDVISTDIERKKPRQFQGFDINILGFSLLKLKKTKKGKYLLKFCKIPIFSFLPYKKSKGEKI